MGAVGAGGNLNLLLAAAVAGAQTDDDDDDSSSDGDHGRDPLTLDEAMELWNWHKTRQGQGSIAGVGMTLSTFFT